VSDPRTLRVALVDHETMEIVTLIPGLAIPGPMVERAAKVLAENMPSIRAMIDATTAAASLRDAFNYANRKR
jgi:hypothetical protein